MEALVSVKKTMKRVVGGVNKGVDGAESGGSAPGFLIVLRAALSDAYSET